MDRYMDFPQTRAPRDFPMVQAFACGVKRFRRDQLALLNSVALEPQRAGKVGARIIEWLGRDP